MLIYWCVSLFHLLLNNTNCDIWCHYFYRSKLLGGGGELGPPLNSSFVNTNLSFENTNSSFENTNSSVQNTSPPHPPSVRHCLQPLTCPFSVVVLRCQTKVCQNTGTLRKLSIQSGWAVSFAIQLGSQLAKKDD